MWPLLRDQLISIVPFWSADLVCLTYLPWIHQYLFTHSTCRRVHTWSSCNIILVDCPDCYAPHKHMWVTVCSNVAAPCHQLIRPASAFHLNAPDIRTLAHCTNTCAQPSCNSSTDLTVARTLRAHTTVCSNVAAPSRSADPAGWQMLRYKNHLTMWTYIMFTITITIFHCLDKNASSVSNLIENIHSST